MDGETYNGMVAIVPGANSGVGLAAAEMLARDGYEVIMACRSEERARKAIDALEKKVPYSRVSFMKLDLSSMQSVRDFAKAFLVTGKNIHILCNNAGMTMGSTNLQRSTTKDDFELTFAVNYLGHFLLTNLLLDRLKETAEEYGEARIVHTSSTLHDPESPGGKRGMHAHLDFDNLFLEKENTFIGTLAYRNSKLANCAFSLELSKRLEGTKVTSNSCCPGYIPATGLARNESYTRMLRNFVLDLLFGLMGVTRSLTHGGEVIHDLATNPKYKGVSGRYFSDFKEIPSSAESRDSRVCQKLWTVSAKLVNIPVGDDL